MKLAELIKFGQSVDDKCNVLYHSSGDVVNIAFSLPIKIQEESKLIEFDIEIDHAYCSIKFILFGSGLIGKSLTLEDTIAILPEPMKTNILFNFNLFKDNFQDERKYNLDLNTLYDFLIKQNP